jgi:hypothetical protein
MEGMDADDGWVRGADTWTGLNGAEIRRYGARDARGCGVPTERRAGEGWYPE